MKRQRTCLKNFTQQYMRPNVFNIPDHLISQFKRAEKCANEAAEAEIKTKRPVSLVNQPGFTTNQIDCYSPNSPLFEFVVD